MNIVGGIILGILIVVVLCLVAKVIERFDDEGDWDI